VLEGVCQLRSQLHRQLYSGYSQLHSRVVVRSALSRLHHRVLSNDSRAAGGAAANL
jgi:hypothetical protein